MFSEHFYVKNRQNILFFPLHFSRSPLRPYIPLCSPESFAYRWHFRHLCFCRCWIVRIKILTFVRWMGPRVCVHIITHFIRPWSHDGGQSKRAIADVLRTNKVYIDADTVAAVICCCWCWTDDVDAFQLSFVWIGRPRVNCFTWKMHCRQCLLNTKHIRKTTFTSKFRLICIVSAWHIASLLAP